MTSALALLSAVVGLSVPAPAPVPDEVTLGLPRMGIEVVDATGVAPAVRARQAVRIAWKRFHMLARPYTSGWVRVDRVTIHLVQAVRSSSSGLFPGQVVWLVVIRDATLPILGPPGRSGPRLSVGPLAVFVGADEPRYILAEGF